MIYLQKLFDLLESVKIEKHTSITKKEVYRHNL